MFFLAAYTTSFAMANAKVESTPKSTIVNNFQIKQNSTIEILSVNFYETLAGCTVTVRFKSDNVDITLSYSAATCADAWAGVSKVVNRFLK